MNGQYDDALVQYEVDEQFELKFNLTLMLVLELYHNNYFLDNATFCGSVIIYTYNIRISPLRLGLI